MNILYLGPYRQNNINGWTSTSLLKHLLSSKKNNITCRPVYVEPSNTITEVEGIIKKSENTTYEHYDSIIQHANIDSLIKINGIEHNIAIPIINDKLMNSENLENLCNFDKILVDTKLTYNRLQQYKEIKNKVKTYDYELDIKSSSNSSFHIGILEQSKKIYFIGKYDSNLNNIVNICKAFIHNIQSNEYVLILFLFDLDLSKKKYIESIINQYYLLHNMKYTINRTIIIPIDTKLDNMLVAHQTGNIYLDLQDDNSNSLNVKIASMLNKSIVQFNYDDMVFLFDRNNQHNTMGFTGVSEKAINREIYNCMNNNINKPQIFKKENILNLL